MKHLLILLLSVTTVFQLQSQEAEPKDTLATTTTYYLIRHAEKDRTDKTNRDPHLTESGNQRAENWAKILKEVKFDLVYSTTIIEQKKLPRQRLRPIQLK